MGDVILFSHLNTVLSAVKCCLQRRVEDKFLFKAHVVVESLFLFLHQHFESERYVLGNAYQPCTLHTMDHIWNQIINTTMVYNDDEFYLFPEQHEAPL
jgi:hypothetical protein